jgi:hypothetical protein
MDGEVDSMIYFTSDLYFYHKNVIKHANRPYSDEDEMNKELFLAIDIFAMAVYNNIINN